MYFHYRLSFDNSLLLQYDAAVDPVIAKTKVKEDSQVAGRATVLVVPDLNVGNIVYKVRGSTAQGSLSILTLPIFAKLCNQPDLLLFLGPLIWQCQRAMQSIFCACLRKQIEMQRSSDSIAIKQVEHGCLWYSRAL